VRSDAASPERIDAILKLGRSPRKSMINLLDILAAAG
jgi:hypothetical protein